MTTTDDTTPAPPATGGLLDPIDLPEVTEEWKVDQIRQHLREYHTGNRSNWALNSLFRGKQSFNSCRKDTIMAVHRKLHDQPHWTETEAAREQYMQVDHVHSELLPETPDTSGSPQTADGTPLLSRGQQVTLERLVDADFGALKTEIAQMAADALQLALATVDAEFREVSAKGPAYADELLKLTRRHADELAALHSRASEDGLVYKNNSFVPRDRDARVAQVTQENQHDKERALRTLERKRLGTHRTVLLTGLTGAAQAVLTAIPDASQLMVEAAKERADAQRTARAINAAAQE